MKYILINITLFIISNKKYLLTKDSLLIKNIPGVSINLSNPCTLD